MDCAVREGALEQAATFREQAFAAADRLGEDDPERWFHQGWLWIERARAHLGADRHDEALAAYASAEATT